MKSACKDMASRRIRLSKTQLMVSSSTRSINSSHTSNNEMECVTLPGGPCNYRLGCKAPGAVHGETFHWQVVGSKD